MKEGGYKRLMKKFLALRQRVYNRHVETIWSISKEECVKQYTFADTYEQAFIAGMTGHELRIRVLSGSLVCELVKNPSA
jgi:hypothetical protein